jgi:membrane protease YdiL (CAAX protease family)
MCPVQSATHVSGRSHSFFPQVPQRCIVGLLARSGSESPSHLRVLSFRKYHVQAMDSLRPKEAHEMPDGEAAARLLRPAPEVRLATALRGFGPLGLLAILVILAGNTLFLPLSALLALVWAWVSHTPWCEIGYVRPKSWLATISIGLVFGIAFKFLMKALVMPLLGAPPINQAYHYLAGNRAAIPGFLYVVIVGAGFGEETIFRGYLFERFGKLFGHSAAAKTAIVLLTSIWFGLAHYSTQGLPGAEQATITGLVFGTIFALTGSLWMLMVAHAAFDLTAYALIYWNLETTVAHLVFK